MGAPVHYEQTVREENAASVSAVRVRRYPLSKQSDGRMRRVCAGAPVPYEQTVRAKDAASVGGYGYCPEPVGPARPGRFQHGVGNCKPAPPCRVERRAADDTAVEVEQLRLGAQEADAGGKGQMDGARHVIQRASSPRVSNEPESYDLDI